MIAPGVLKRYLYGIEHGFQLVVAQRKHGSSGFLFCFLPAFLKISRLVVHLRAPVSCADPSCRYPFCRCPPNDEASPAAALIAAVGCMPGLCRLPIIVR